MNTLITNIDNITLSIKNRYVSHDELDMLINKLDTLLNISIQSKKLLSTGPHYGLDVIFPAMEHLKLFLYMEDLGSIALVSKTLYDLMVINFTQLQIDICILKYYIKMCKYDVNINFVVFGQELSVPIPVNIIALQKLRLLIGFDEYFKNYNYILLKSDFVSLKKVKVRFLNDDMFMEYTNMVLNDFVNLNWCIHCETIVTNWCEHRQCEYKYQKNDDKCQPGKYIKYLQPELQYYAVKQLKENYKPILICTNCCYKHYIYEKKMKSL
jgi:hypothetical protein